MRFTRHAKTRLRLYSDWLTAEQVAALVADENRIAPDPAGRPRHRASLAVYEVTLVAALDSPDLIITIYAH